MRTATACCLLMVLIGAPLAYGDLIGNVSTGFDNGTGLVIDAGLPDPDYTITPGDLIATVLPESFPIPPWLANTATSKWVGFDNPGSNALAGDFDYTTTVTLAGYDPATAFITGGWATDNGGVDILINGVSTGVTNDGNFGALHAFSNVGLGLFQEGANTIAFRLNNAPPDNNPSGLRVDAGLYASAGEQPFDFVIHNTGVDDSGVTLADNAVDSHWTLSGTGPAEGQGPDAIVATGAGAFPIGPWLSDAADVTSAWITPAEDTAAPGATDGTAIYQFSTSFTTSGDGAVTISGLHSADNQVVDVQLDGVSGTFTPVGFNAFADFSVSGDVTGTEHTLSFFVQNGSGEANPDGPLGLRVSIETAGFVPVPEPSMLVMLTATLLGLAVLARRKRNA